jgi:hypothetical protein
MPRLKGPLFSLSASGLLAPGLQLLNTRHGTIAKTHTKATPPELSALRSNTLLMKIAHAFMTQYDLHTNGFCVDWAKTANTTLRSAYLHFALLNWAALRPIPWDNEQPTNTDLAYPATLEQYDTPADAQKLVQISADEGAQYTTIHALTPSRSELAPNNAFDEMHLNQYQKLIQIPNFKERPVSIVAASWIVGSNDYTTSNILHWILQ